MEKPSFVVTGASATGKTTLIESAMAIGYEHLPTYTTREIRPGEIDGIYSKFVTEEEITERFNEGEFIEDSLDYMRVNSTGIYYGTPRLWTEQLRYPEKCATPVAPKIARKVVELSGVVWVHLVCSDEDRIRRLEMRGVNNDELQARMYSGESIETPQEAVKYDTSEATTQEILNGIIHRR